MPKRLTTILLSLLLILASCNRGQRPGRPTEVSAVEYEVLSAWLGSKITAKARVNGLTQIVIYDTTDSDDDRLLRDDNGQPIPWENRQRLCGKKLRFSSKVP